MESRKIKEGKSKSCTKSKQVQRSRNLVKNVITKSFLFSKGVGQEGKQDAKQKQRKRRALLTLVWKGDRERDGKGR